MKISAKIKGFFENIGNSIKVFPYSYILLIIATILWILNVFDIWWYRVSNLMLSVYLAFLFSLYQPLYHLHSPTKSKSKLPMWLWIIIPTIIWVGYYFLIRKVDLLSGSNLTTIEIIQYVWIFLLAVIWIFLLIARLTRNNQKRTCFSRSRIIIAVVLGSLACLVIWWWISWALASIEALFDIYISSEVYQVVRVISWMLLSWVFALNDYQFNISNAEKIADSDLMNSRVRKIFWSFIFLPLTAIYLLIFFAYWLKILITGVRPKWIIVRLWIGYFALWIITEFLTYPQETKLKDLSSKIINISFLYTASMMICAITMRILQYGTTVNRYFVCSLIVLIFVYSILSIFTHKKNRLILVSTWFLLVLLSIYWPFNAKHTALRSQISRLNSLITEYNISIPFASGSLSAYTWSDWLKFHGVITELLEEYKISERNKWYLDQELLDQVNKLEYRYQKKEKVLSYLWLQLSKWRYDGGVDIYDEDWEKLKYINFNVDTQMNPFDIQWYSMLYTAYSRYDNFREVKTNVWTFKIWETEYKFDLNDYKDEILSRSNKEVNVSPIIIEQENIKFIINWLYWTLKNDKMEISSLDGYILVK